jgi:hypothetical protein
VIPVLPGEFEDLAQWLLGVPHARSSP